MPEGKQGGASEKAAKVRLLALAVEGELPRIPPPGSYPGGALRVGGRWVPA